jgi:Flp pilus assembly protein TadB
LDILAKGQALYQDWTSGLTAADNVMLLAIGFGLMIFAVAALLWQRSREKGDANNVRVSEYAESVRAVPGERHVVARQKGDAFLRRIDQLA